MIPPLSKGDSTSTSLKRPHDGTNTDRAASSKLPKFMKDDTMRARNVSSAPKPNMKKRSRSDSANEPQPPPAKKARAATLAAARKPAMKKGSRSGPADEPQPPPAKSARAAPPAATSKSAMKKHPRTDPADVARRPPAEKKASAQLPASHVAQSATTASTLQPPTKKKSSAQTLAKHVARPIKSPPPSLVCDLCGYKAKAEHGLSQHRGKGKCQQLAAKLAKEQAALPKSSTPAAAEDSSSNNDSSSPARDEAPPKKKQRVATSPPSDTDSANVQSGTRPIGLLNLRSASAGNAALQMLAASLTDQEIDMLCASGDGETPMFGLTNKELVQYDSGELRGMKKTSFEEKVNEVKEDIMATAMTWGAADNKFRCDPAYPKEPAVKIAPYLGQVLKNMRKAEKAGCDTEVTAMMLQMVFAYSGQKYLSAMDGTETNSKSALEQREYLDRIDNESNENAAEYLQNLLKAVSKECPDIADRFKLKMASFGACSNEDCEAKTQDVETFSILQIKVPKPETDVAEEFEKYPNISKKSRMEMTLASDGTERFESVAIEPEKDADRDEGEDDKEDDDDDDENPLADLMALDPEEVPITRTTKTLIEETLNYHSISQVSCDECETSSSISAKKALTVYPAYVQIPITRSDNEAELHITLDDIAIGEAKYSMTAMVQQDVKSGHNVAFRKVEDKWWQLSDENVSMVKTANLQDQPRKKCTFVLLKKN